MNEQELADSLPPAMEDEPEGLRQAIVDELLDHLACATRREQLHGAASTQDIWERVLTRFGNPTAIAAQLYWDGMKGQLMQRRLISATLLILIAAALTCLGLVWRIAQAQMALQGEWNQQVQTLVKEVQSLREGLQQARLANEEAKESRDVIVQSGTAVASPNRPTDTQLARTFENKTPAEWVPVTLKFVEGTSDGPPAQGVKVNAVYAPGTDRPDGDESLNLEGESDANGLTKWEFAHYGSYRVGLSYHDFFCWSLADEQGVHKNLVVRPGQPIEMTIVVPSQKVNWQPSKVRIAWPEDYRSYNPIVAIPYTPWSVTLPEARWDPSAPDAPISKGDMLHLNSSCIDSEGRWFRSDNSQPFIAALRMLPESYFRKEWRLDPAIVHAGFPWESAALAIAKGLVSPNYETSLGQPPIDQADMDAPPTVVWAPGPDIQLTLGAVLLPIDTIAPKFTPLAMEVNKLAGGSDRPVSDKFFVFANSGPAVENGDQYFVASQTLASQKRRWKQVWSKKEGEMLVLTITPDDEVLEQVRKTAAYYRELDAQIPDDATEQYMKRRKELGLP